jgi:DNA polymerase-3 subunit alpha
MDDGVAGIRFGLSMIKNVGEGAAESLIESRTEVGGSFATLDDLCRTLNARNVNKRSLESLVKAGALDSVAGSADARGSLLLNLDRIVSIAQSSQKLRETGQATMFDLFGAEVATPLSGIDLESAPLPRGEVLAWEKELLGVWLSEHPFTRAAPQLAPFVSALCNEIAPDLLPDLPSQGRDFIIAGMVGSTRRLATRDGRSFIAAELEDLSGSLEVTVWPDIYERSQELWVPGSIVLAQVRVRERGDRLSAGLQEVVPFEDNFLPPSWVSEIPAASPVRVAGGNGNGRGNGNGHAGDDGLSALLQGTGNAEDAVPFEAPATPAPDPAPYTPVSVPKPPPAREPRLALVLEESEDEDGDQRRLAGVFSLLQANPGPDAVQLTIRTRAGETIDLALPSAALDDALQERLRQALGHEAVPA